VPSIQNEVVLVTVKVIVLPELEVVVLGNVAEYELPNERLDSIAEPACMRSLLTDEVATDVRHEPYDTRVTLASIPITEITTISSTIVKADRNLFFVIIIIELL
jgi:hypothetical protein